MSHNASPEARRLKDTSLMKHLRECFGIQFFSARSFASMMPNWALSTKI